MFYDKAKIYIKSGDGGDGMIAFRREKYVPHGGPEGGDGGRGGSIIFEVNRKLNSLAYFYRKVHFKATRGSHGGTSNKTGRMGETVRLQVPPGTLIRHVETDELLADLTEHGQEALLLSGGKGGRGNARFKRSANQAPNVAERGEPGEELWIRLELKLIADVGIAGVPNAGKSTLLSRISSAKPKIASYAFTTLQPHLGVVNVGDFQTIVFADIPGLIEGASEGIGLGHEFLRHIERTRVLVHLLNGEAENPIEDWAMINQELALYDAGLEQKPQLVVLNKIDGVDGEAWRPIVEEHMAEIGVSFCSISAVTGKGVQDMIYRVQHMLDNAPEPVTKAEAPLVIRAGEDPDAFEIEKVNPTTWRVTGKRIERIATMTYFEFEATAERFQRILDRMGITKALIEAGALEGHMVQIADAELEWQEG